MRLVRSLLLAAALLGPVATQAADRIKDVMSVQGVRANQLVGYGIVVGLDGTGDQTTQTPFTVQTINSMLSKLGIQVPPNVIPQLRNVAAVMVTATLPAFSKPGQQIDVTVSSMGNARSLRAVLSQGFRPIGSEVLIRPSRPTDRPRGAARSADPPGGQRSRNGRGPAGAGPRTV